MKPLFLCVLFFSAWTFAQVSAGHAQEAAQPAAAQPAVNGPTLAPISVDLLAANISEVNEALSKATGLPFMASRASQPAAFSLAAKDRPFWEVFEQLSSQNTLNYRPGQYGIELSVQGAPVPMLVSGPVLLMASVTKPDDPAAPAAARGRGAARGPASIIAGTVASSGGPGAPPSPPAETKFVLSLAAIVDPRTIATRVGFNQPEVLDDKGQPFKVLEILPLRLGAIAGSGPWQPRPDDYERLNYWVWRIALAAPENGGQAVGSFKGVVNLRVSAKDTSVRLDDVENKHHDEAIEIGANHFTLADVTLSNGRLLSARYSVELAGTEGVADSVAPLRVELQNANGQRLAAVQVTRINAARALSANSGTNPPPPFPFTPPFSIVLKTSERMEPVQIPFEIKSLLLP